MNTVWTLCALSFGAFFGEGRASTSRPPPSTGAAVSEVLRPVGWLSTPRCSVMRSTSVRMSNAGCSNSSCQNCISSGISANTNSHGWLGSYGQVATCPEFTAFSRSTSPLLRIRSACSSLSRMSVWYKRAQHLEPYLACIFLMC